MRPETLLVLIMAAGLGGLAGLASGYRDGAPAAGQIDSLHGCRVTDGDTIRCGTERIRLLGIDAPELPGHCHEGRICAPGDPYAASTSLEEAMDGALHINRVGVDHYGRTLAMVSGGNGDLSCWQLAHHQAIYKGNWDNGLRVARTCPRSVW